MDLVKLAPCMSPAGHLVDAGRPIKMVEACIGVGLQCPREVLQVLPRMFALAILRVSEPDRGWCLAPGWAVIAHIGP